MNIRPATEKDIPAILEIKNMKDPALFLKRIEENTKGKNIYLIIEDNDEVVGHVLFEPNGSKTQPGYPHIEDLRIKENQRGKGYGTALIKECERLSTERGFTSIGLSVNKDPECPAQKLYKKLGYIVISPEPYLGGIYDGDEEWVVDMKKDL